MLNFLITQRIYSDCHGQISEALEINYRKFFGSLGINLYPISSFEEDLERYLKRIQYDGLILSGGGDISPEFGGIKDYAELNCSSQRDRACSYLIDKMILHKLPILGICYGMQLLNCQFGGRLVANIHAKKADSRKPGSNHAIKFKKAIYGFSGKYLVNHYHNHGLKRTTVADCFDVFAEDADFDIVEGIIHNKLPVMGIQWHPERKSPDIEFNKMLIKKFLKI